MSQTEAYAEACRRIQRARAEGGWLLDLGDLPLDEIPCELGQAPALSVLALGKEGALQGREGVEWEYRASRPSQRFSDLSSLEGLTALEALDLRECAELKDLSPLAGLTRLRSLNLSHCVDLTDLSPLTGLTALEYLDLSRCKGVQDLSPLAGLTRLGSLNLSHCADLTDLSPLARLTALGYLELSWCASLTGLAPLADLTALRSLYLVGCAGLRDLGPLAGLRALESLDLSHCAGLKDLSALARLTALRSLDLTRCPGVTELSALAGLTALRSLDLRECAALRDLSPLAGLAALQYLKLSGCKALAGLSPLAGLTALEYLKLSGCYRLRYLTPLSDLTALQSLDLRECANLTDVSPLAGLPALEYLDLSRCKGLKDLSGLLDEHGELPPALKELRLFRCRFNDVPEEICGQSPSENVIDKVRAHFADLRRGQVEDAELKLFVLGNGGVGKTQACRRLSQLPYDDTIPTTHGIQLGEFSMHLEGPHPVQVRFWDFGGQDVYHGTHALFLQGHAVFVVLWGPDDEGGGNEVDSVTDRNHPLAYWLDYIRGLAGTQSPVLVVQGRCDQPRQRRRPPPVPTDDFDYLKCLEFSARTDLGLDLLIAHVKEGVRNLLDDRPLHRIGVGRAEVRHRLRAMLEEDQALPPEQRRHRTLTREAFRQLCSENGKVSDPDALLDFLHRSGVVFYRPGLFEDRIVLDQSWAREAIYTLLDRQRTLPYLARDGRFTRKLLGDLVWQGHSPGEQETFLGIMQSCGLCFRARNLSGDPARAEWEYIAPDLLPAWSGVQDQLFGRLRDTPPTAQATVSYSFLHEGILRAFLSRIGERASDAAVYWKYGCWFGEKTTGSVMLIRSKWGKDGDRTGEITLSAWGGGADQLVERVLETVPCIHLGQPPQVARTSARQDRANHTLEASAGGVQMLVVAPRSPLPPGGKKQVFISYAWGDSGPQGRERAEVVDRLCSQVRGWGYELVRDQDHLRWGELISDFMKLLSSGDRVIVVLSEKYLRSVYCMTELYGIWVQSRNEKQDFLRRIVPVTLADARVGSIRDRVGHARYWKGEVEALKDCVAEMSRDDFQQWRKMNEWAIHVSEILGYLADTLQPFSFEQVAADNFQALRALLEREC
jgi:internalin A